MSFSSVVVRMLNGYTATGDNDLAVQLQKFFKC